MQDLRRDRDEARSHEEQLRALTGDTEALASHIAIWDEARIHLQVSTFLIEPGRLPSSLVTSGRCIVLHRQSVLVMSNEAGYHILPGGRVEQGEDSRQAAIREVKEEAGITVRSLSPLAIIMFRHLTPKPDGYPYPYPTFINDVYVTHLAEEPPLDSADRYETSGAFIPISEAIPIIAEHEAELLLAASRSRRTSA